MPQTNRKGGQCTCRPGPSHFPPRLIKVSRKELIRNRRGIGRLIGLYCICESRIRRRGIIARSIIDFGVNPRQNIDLIRYNIASFPRRAGREFEAIGRLHTGNAKSSLKALSSLKPGAFPIFCLRK